MQSNEKKEYLEAVEAGNRALNSLKNAQKELGSARNWGIADLLGGGMISTFAKRSKMKEAQSYIEEAKRDLQVFRRELSDISTDADMNVLTGDFLTFADYFLDSFVADWLVQDRINKTGEQVDEAVRRVEKILSGLQKF